MPAHRRTYNHTMLVHAGKYDGTVTKPSLQRTGATRVNLKNILSGNRAQTPETSHILLEVLVFTGACVSKLIQLCI